MIIVTKNSKIIAVDKELLKKINVTLENLSSIINTIELELSSIKKETLKINDKEFNISKKELLSIENINIFELEEKNSLKTLKIHDISIHKETIEEIKSQTPQIKPLIETIEPLEQLESEIKLEEIKPIEIEETKPNPKHSTSQDIEPNIKTELNPILTQEIKSPLEPKLKEIQHPIKETSSQTNHSLETKHKLETTKIDIQQTPKAPTKPEVSTMEISINFEDEFSEIEQMLDLSKEDATKALENELENASKELGIDVETIYELKEELFEILKEDKKDLLSAIKEKDYNKIHKTAHKLKGAALNLRLSNLALILKKIDELSRNKTDLHKIEYLTNKFYNFLEKIDTHSKPKDKIPPEIKSLIIKTVEDYLLTQNDKKFQKDKKYIEKLLKVKINSIQDLQNIIKE